MNKAIPNSYQRCRAFRRRKNLREMIESEPDKAEAQGSLGAWRNPAYNGLNRAMYIGRF